MAVGRALTWSGLGNSSLGAAVYLALLTLWVYGVADGADTYCIAWLLLLVAFAQVAAGLVVRSWWAILLPVLVVVISIPAGQPDSTPGEEAFPLWFGLAFAALLATPLVAFGVAARKIHDR